MSRPFIEFIQAQQLDWAASVVTALRPGTSAKPLSRDADSGASSTIVRYPAGWCDDEGSVLSADEEVFVLEGELTIGEVTHGRYSYAHLPAGFHRPGMRSGPGAVVLTFFSAEPERASADGHAADLVTERVIEKVDAFEGDWGGNFHPRFPPGAGRKWLRRDPVTGDETWILGTMPLRSGRRPERHPVVEEMLLLSGTLVGHVGEMRPGAYFWRPPEEWHGPFGSMTGNLMLFRTVGGPLSTEYTQDEVPFSWDAEHRPILPPELQGLVSAPGCGCSPY
jgi:hypothetical protein